MLYICRWKGDDMKTSKQDRRIAAINAANHRSNIEAAAAADRHARSFAEMFSINAPVGSLTPSDEYLADLEKIRGTA
jgi:hypothetical protein